MSLLAGQTIATGKAAADELDADRPTSGGFRSVNYFSLKKPGDRTILRFLLDHDAWYTFLVHSFVSTRPRPDFLKSDAKWPKNADAICRQDRKIKHLFDDGCYVCTMKKDDGKSYFPQPRTWALAVEREEVLGTQKMIDDGLVPAENEFGQSNVDQVVGYRDVMIEVDETDAEGKSTGSKIKVPNILVVNQAQTNFFDPMWGFASVYKNTVLDRDYHVTRVGTGRETDYNIAPLDPIPGLDMRTKQADGRTLGQTYIEDYKAPDLLELIERKLEDEHFHRYFDIRFPVPQRKSDTSSGNDGASNGAAQNGPSPATPAAAPTQPAAPQESDADIKARMDAMRARALGDNPAPANNGAAPATAGARVSGPINFS